METKDDDEGKVNSTVAFRAALAGVAAPLIEEMTRSWRQGRRLLAEELLARHPEVAVHGDAVADLIYQEICLRQESGQPDAWDDALRRFPQWHAQLILLRQCHDLLQAGPDDRFPKVDDTLGDFRLLANLGQGAHGCVFLASQTDLADRLVVLKITPQRGREHLSLARLQHTHIVPLYAVFDDQKRGLRILCMPYFGGATLEQILKIMGSGPVAQRRGQDLVRALDQAAPQASRVAREAGRCQAPFSAPEDYALMPKKVPDPTARDLLCQAGYVEAICSIGICLGEALQYAGERGLVHLDLKPGNVLLAADGQPMLLDFHLAREPVPAGKPAQGWVGGTLRYMSPEQHLALAAVRSGQPIPVPVDARTDVYGLGITLYEALGGTVPMNSEHRPSLRQCNPQVSLELSDIIGKCLSEDPGQRYASAGALAADLRRHLTHRPVLGVPTRSWRERWQKWRRRRPQAMASAGILLIFLAALTALALGFGGHIRLRQQQAKEALAQGRDLLAKGLWEEARAAFRQGGALINALPFQNDVKQQLDDGLVQADKGSRRARHNLLTQDLHRLADELRFLYGATIQGPDTLRRLAERCREVWQKRDIILEQLTDGDEAWPGRLRADLLDVAILGADFQVRSADPALVDQVRREVLLLLDQAASSFGPSPILELEKQIYRAALVGGPNPMPSARLAPRTAWEHFALGRYWFRVGKLESAATHFEKALSSAPQVWWPHFFHGLAALRLGRAQDALLSFTVCQVLLPQSAQCVYHRGLAYNALKQPQRALADFSRALELDPALAPAALNRGILHFEAGRHAAAIADLLLALRLGADPAAVHYNLALVFLDQHDNQTALEHVRHALNHDANHAQARKLQEQLTSLPPSP